jgi:hypothetical protein
MGAIVGAQACLPEGEECRSIGTCTPEPDFDGRNDDCSPKVLKYTLVSVSDNIIQEISGFNPRVAAVLIGIRSIKVEFTVGKVNFAPVELTAEDILKRLTLPKSSEYFEERQRKVRRAVATMQEPITYEFVLNKNSRNSFLLIRPLSSVESQSSFEINLSEIPMGRGKNTSIRFEAESWKMN